METKIIEEAIEDFNLFLQTTKPDQRSSQGSLLSSTVTWKPPEIGMLMINGDGAFSARTRKGGVGMLVRDHGGKILGATAVPIQDRSSAEVAEAEGFRIALDCSICSAGGSYIVEGDAQAVINMLQGKSKIKACLDVIGRDTLSFVSRFHSCSFHFIPRDGNRVANALAKHALSLEAPLTWQRNFPSWVQREASFDVSVSSN
ncbi:hypothetical protein RHMOL_Rhmol05G0253500 [Rhododendron molle]|uniref:Uncharacterized protein n=1 Tax=Rhododendron molle TaxID=49168 RepID=A0ACC0NTZ9_RHOML|nr:hypothetical protein RHMOL_Rhmol05G0253500 [Rhododendron molle]